VARDTRIQSSLKQQTSLNFINNPSVILGNTSLKFVHSPSFNVWQEVGARLLTVADSSTWWIADWLVLGESVFQDRYLEAIRKTQLNYQTLRNYAWVARRIERDRRREDLTFGHHAEVAALDQPEQDYWLRRATEYRWPRNRLRSEIRASLREREDKKGTREAGLDGADVDDSTCLSERNSISRTLELRVMPGQFELFKSIADGYGMPLHEWAINTLNTMAIAIMSNGNLKRPSESLVRTAE
jgi:hypothetical protein